MAHPYKLTIPQDVGELNDHLGWMVLSCPDFPASYAGQSADTAFDELQLGIDNAVRSAAKREALHAMAALVRFHCDNAQTREAINVLEQMSEFLRRKTVTNDNA
jgi:hypothetical protein